ncbi:MAG: ATP-binding protein [Bacillota bacterium]|uniref:ATP-binding protein n=1 Tax=Desulfurispora thermophila TaxID=265470 RepID=UPI0003717DDC|nr:ATP-binding protein [Desulfurispora thermophila]
MSTSEITEKITQLVIYRNLHCDPVLVSWRELQNHAGDYQHLARLFDQVQHCPHPLTGCNWWQNHLLDLIMLDDNIGSRAMAACPTGEQESCPALSGQLRSLLERELAVLQVLYHWQPDQVHLPAGTEGYWQHIWQSSPPARSPRYPDQQAFWQHKKALAAAFEENPAAILDALEKFHTALGYGLLSRFFCFTWQGSLQPVTHPDSPPPDALHGYLQERETLRENTARLVSGLPAVNILLYGDRGTGKSSAVKSLLHLFGQQRLRLVEMDKTNLSQYSVLLNQLAELPYKFIIFLDDLSFEELETDYKQLKAMLEGSVRRRPDNVVIYATSNRRHLVSETFREQDKHPQDSVQEKLSLADRFGLCLMFSAPGEQAYLEMVLHLARQAGLDWPRDALLKQARLWAMWHNGYSGRTARQLVDYLYGRWPGQF